MKDKSKILIVSCTYPPVQSATANLISKLLPCFKKYNCEVDGLTVKTSFSEKSKMSFGDSIIYKTNCLLVYPKPIKCVRDFFYTLLCKIRSRKIKLPVPVYNDKIVNSFIVAMKNLNLERYNMIIAVSAYYDVAEALIRYKKEFGLTTQIALYQVDPLSENKIYCSEKNREYLQEYEKTLYKEFDFIFTTPLILKRKKMMKWDVSKVHTLEFPIQIGVSKRKTYRNDGQIICIYSGYLYGNLRDATYTLQLFSKMQNKNIHLYIIGNGQEELLKKYSTGELQGRLHLLGQRSLSESDKILSEADVFVNIGNRVDNQVPSKLFHYLGFGRPIVNVVANEECPTIPYTEKYPLALNVQEKETISEQEVSYVEKWIENHSNDRVDINSIYTLFVENTPDYIVKKILACVRKGIKSES